MRAHTVPGRAESDAGTASRAPLPAGQVRPPRLTPFQSAGYLFTPDRPDWRAVVIEAGPDWRFDRAAIERFDSAVWGRNPARIGPIGPIIGLAARREIALLRRRLSRQGRFGLRAVHRLRPVGRPGRIRSAMRRVLLDGLLLEFGPPERPPLVIEQIEEAAGARPDKRRGYRPISGGAVSCERVLHDGRAVLLRAVRRGGLKDLDRAATAYAYLADHGVGRVPRLVGRGSVAQAAWTSEILIDGTIQRHVTPGMLGQAVDFCFSLPRSGRPASSYLDHLATIGRVHSRWASFLEDLAEVLRARVEDVPGITLHGDLWAGNLLARGGRLMGVIDWDTWHPSGLPGTDLLHLSTMEIRRRTGQELGGLWRERVWRSTAFRDSTTRYWPPVGVRPDERYLDIVALDWWAGQVVVSFSRELLFAEDPGWIERNIDAVLEDVRATVPI